MAIKNTRILLSEGYGEFMLEDYLTAPRMDLTMNICVVVVCELIRFIARFYSFLLFCRFFLFSLHDTRLPCLIVNKAPPMLLYGCFSSLLKVLVHYCDGRRDFVSEPMLHLLIKRVFYTLAFLWCKALECEESWLNIAFVQWDRLNIWLYFAGHLLSPKSRSAILVVSTAIALLKILEK